MVDNNTLQHITPDDKQRQGSVERKQRFCHLRHLGYCRMENHESSHEGFRAIRSKSTHKRGDDPQKKIKKIPGGVLSLSSFLGFTGNLMEAGALFTTQYIGCIFV